MWSEYSPRDWLVSHLKDAEIQGVILASFVIFMAFMLGFAIFWGEEYARRSTYPPRIAPAVSPVKASKIELVPVSFDRLPLRALDGVLVVEGDRYRPIEDRTIWFEATAADTEEPDTRLDCLAPKAVALIRSIEGKFGRQNIISTCRPGAVIEGTTRPSLHRNGNAIDFIAGPGQKADIIQWLVAHHKSGGTMTYADHDHIHVDVGRHYVSLATKKRGGEYY